jgi:preprotein translocase subunit SecG
MQIFFIIIHVIVSLLLVGVVLMQSSKGGGLAGAFGGGGGLPQQMFGSKAMTTALTRITIYLAAAFFVTSALIFVMTAETGTRSVRDEALGEGALTTEETQPAATQTAPIETPAAETTTDGGGQ